MSKPGYVYLICDPIKDYFKIGVTTGSIEKRMKKLQTGNGAEMFVLKYHKTEHPFKIEKLLHNHFSTKRVLNEWFALDIKDVANFDQICDKMEGIIDCLKDNYWFKI